MKSAVEIEIKLAIANASQGRKLLRNTGFELHKKRIFERNLVLDDDAQTLRNTERLLRIRQAGKAITCTFKGPPKPGVHKQREEREFEASNFEQALRFFAGLGFIERFRYEKYRTEYKQSGTSGAATLDETPIGCYLELEGKSRWIDCTARELGFARKDYITASYGKLYFDWCAANGVRPTNLVFGK